MNAASFPETADIETSSSEYAARFSGAAGQFFLKEQTRTTLQFLKYCKDKTVLDVGGGHCQLAQPLIERGYNLTITGSDPICGKRAAERLPPGSFSYLTCNSLALPFADRSFSVVLSFRLVPHADNWLGLLAELCRVAKEMVIIDYPDIRSFNLFYHLLFHLKKKMEGNTRTYRMFKRKQIAAAFAMHGLDQISFQPQFFWPMVLHRQLQNEALSTGIEQPARATGLTTLFGSPIIVCATRNPALS